MGTGAGRRAENGCRKLDEDEEMHEEQKPLEHIRHSSVILAQHRYNISLQLVSGDQDDRCRPGE